MMNQSSSGQDQGQSAHTDLYIEIEEEIEDGIKEEDIIIQETCVEIEENKQFSLRHTTRLL